MKLGTCDYPEHVPPDEWRVYPARMREVGLSVVRLAEFAWARLEPTRGEFDFGWLDDAIDAFDHAGIKVVMSTPTAAPPAWLIREHPEILPVDAHGRTRKYGSRRHTDYASPSWWDESRRITEVVARRYGQHPAVIGWQTDNEHGCHNTTRSYSPAARGGFQRWLKAKYGTVDALNDAWGAVFWSQTYPDFGHVDLPNLTVYDPNPSQVLDFYRYSSDTLVAYDRMQTEILRAHSPGRFVTHNFMALFSDFDHFKAAEHLDFVSLDNYPTGNLEVSWLPEAHKTRFARVGDADHTALAHDLSRGLKGGVGHWIMEQQCGHINWAPHNPHPAPGAVRLWTLQAWAHGADSVMFFRWRAATMAQEQMHSGLLRHDGAPDRGWREAQDVARLLPDLPSVPVHARAVLLHDYESLWAYGLQPHTTSASYWAQFYLYSRALRALGVDVDVRHPDQPLDGYDVIVAPALTIISHETAERLERLVRAGAHLVLGARTGSRQPSGQVWPEGAPGPLGALAGAYAISIDAMRPGLTGAVTLSGRPADVHTWAEALDLRGAHARATHDGGPFGGEPASTMRAVERGSVRYIGVWSEDVIERELMDALDDAGVAWQRLPDGVRVSRRGGVRLRQDWTTGHVTLERESADAPAGAHVTSAGGDT